MSRESELRVLASELSRCWHQLGRVLAGRRLVETLHQGSVAKLSPTKRRALDVLAEGEARVGELAAQVGVEETTATRLVDRLEQLGLVERGSLAADRRVTVVRLTAAGQKLVADVAVRRERFFCEVLAELEPEERAELVRLTAKAAGALREHSVELIAR